MLYIFVVDVVVTLQFKYWASYCITVAHTCTVKLTEIAQNYNDRVHYDYLFINCSQFVLTVFADVFFIYISLLNYLAFYKGNIT